MWERGFRFNKKKIFHFSFIISHLPLGGRTPIDSDQRPISDNEK
jgi:hypothetical protein